MHFRTSRLCVVVALFSISFAGLAEAGWRRCRPGRASVCGCKCLRQRVPGCFRFCGPTPVWSPHGWVPPGGPRLSPRGRPRALAADTFPDVGRPAPTGHTFNGCPPEGDTSGDTILNLRKNRDDDGQYVGVPFESVLNLPQPPSRVHRVFRADWADEDTALVARYEGTPVMVEGFLANARQEKGEKCNCNGGEMNPDPAMCDIHVWLTGQADKDRTRAVVVEVTPRGKDKHPAWTETALKKLANQNTPVRISGWLMFDQDHYEQLENTRGTLWEIHPIMQIEVFQDGEWNKLDDQTACSAFSLPLPAADKFLRAWSGLPRLPAAP
jgi:hypothetical protein